MEVDAPPVPLSRSSPYTVNVDDTSSFDLESYASLYTTSYTSPRDKINRLLFIGTTCPQLAVQALTLAIQAIKNETLDTELYHRALTELEKAQKANGMTGDVETEDGEWVSKTEKEARNGIGKLEVDLKTYTNNLIKESTRLTCRDLAMYQAKCGESNIAIRTWLKSREFCTTNVHLLEMCMGIVELALESGNYPFVKSYVGKAEGALESITSSSSKAQTSTAAAPKPGTTISDAYKQSVQHRLLIASSIADMALGKFAEAARGFVRVKAPDLRTVLNEKGELQSGSAGGVAASSAVAGAPTASAAAPGSSIPGPAASTPVSAGIPLNEFLVPPADIGVYAVICGLATMNRKEVKELLVDNNELRAILDSEAGLREIVREVGSGTSYGAAFRALGVEVISGKGKGKSTSPNPNTLRVGELTNLKARLELDIHLAGSNKLEVLRGMIRDKLVARYFEPFEKLALNRMGIKFGWTEDDIEAVVVDLIERGILQGRVDKRDRVLVARSLSSRKAAFCHALKMGMDAERQTNALLLRMKLLELEMYVGAIKSTVGDAGPQQQGQSQGLKPAPSNK